MTKVKIKNLRKGIGIGVSYLGNSKIKKVYVPFYYPNEVVYGRISRIGRKNVLLIEDIEKEKLIYERIQPKCKYFFSCGGCQLQNIKYEDELKLKQELIKKAFSELVDYDVDYELVYCEPYHYRNRLDLIVHQNSLCFRKLFRYDFFVRIESCEIALPKINQLIQEINVILDKGMLPKEMVFTQKPELKPYFVIRVTDVDSLVIFSYHHSFSITQEFLSSLKNLSCNSIIVTKRYASSDVSFEIDSDYIVLKGHEFLTTKIEIDKQVLTITYPWNSFFQTNQLCLSKLLNSVYSSILELFSKYSSNTASKLVVWDLFSGIGLFSLPLALYKAFVYGFDINASSIKFANANAKLNNLERFAKYFVRDLYHDSLDDFTKPDVIIVDPPRQGLTKKAINMISSFSPKIIAYVSCNYSTQVNDLKLLLSKSNNYRIYKVITIDMFPRTGHVENVVVLVKEG